MTEVIGIDHIYIAVSDLNRSEVFYDHVLLEALGFRKNKFALGGDPHVQYFNRHFGYVLRPSRTETAHDSYPPVTQDATLVQELAPYRGEKGNLSFQLSQPLPIDLIGRVAIALHSEYEHK